MADFQNSGRVERDTRYPLIAIRTMISIQREYA